MAKKRTKSIFECPASDCQGGDQNRQSDLTEGQLDLLDNVTRSRIGSSGRRCSYCGCVYNFDQNRHPRVYGSLNNGVQGRGWHPRIEDPRMDNTDDPGFKLMSSIIAMADKLSLPTDETLKAFTTAITIIIDKEIADGRKREELYKAISASLLDAKDRNHPRLN